MTFWKPSNCKTETLKKIHSSYSGSPIPSPGPGGSGTGSDYMTNIRVCCKKTGGTMSGSVKAGKCGIHSGPYPMWCYEQRG